MEARALLPEPQSLGRAASMGQPARQGRPVASSIVRMLAGTTLASGLTVALTAVYTGALAGRLGPQEFGAYMLAMRAAALLLPFVTLAMGIAIPRYVALAPETERSAYLRAGLLLALAPTLAVAVVAALVPGTLAALVFGDRRYAPLVYGSLAVLIGYAAHTVFYGYCRGLERMRPANWGQLLFTGVLPAIVVFWPGLAPHTLQVLVGIGVTAALPLAYVIPRLWPPKVGTEPGTTSAARRLASYGAPRAPGGVLLQLLLDFGPFLVPHVVAMAGAGFLLAGQAVYRVAETVCYSLGVVILPRVAVLHAEGRTAFLRERVSDLLACVFQTGLFLSLHLLVWTGPLILTWLGPQYGAAVPVVQVTLAGLIPYLAYVSLRSVIDGIEHRPVNTLNLAAALGVEVAACAAALYFKAGLAGIAAAMAVGLWTLAGLSVRFLSQRIGLEWRHLMLGQSLLLNAVLLGLSLAGAAVLRQGIGGIPLLLAGAGMEGLLFLGYCLLVWRAGARWADELYRRVLPRFSEAAA